MSASWRPNRLPALRRAADAEPRGRHRLEPGVTDLLATRLALPVGAFFELRQRVVHLAQTFEEAGRERVDLSPLRRHLARIGKALVEVEPSAFPTVRTARGLALGCASHMTQLHQQLLALFGELGASSRVSHLRHGRKPTAARPRSWLAGGPAHRPRGAARGTPSCTPGWSRGWRARG